MVVGHPVITKWQGIVNFWVFISLSFLQFGPKTSGVEILFWIFDGCNATLIDTS